jgi:hypothetical protein
MRPYRKCCKVALKRLQFGGRRQLRRRCWLKFTVLYSMKRFLTNGGGILLLRETVDGSPVLAQIGWRSSW